MADLGNQQIKDTYNGLLKAEDSTQPIPASGTTPIEDGEGNTTALKLGRSGQGAEISGDLDVTNDLEVGGESEFIGQTHLFSASNAKVGVRTTNPTSAFEVNGAFKAKGLNIDSKNLFISDNFDYVVFGTYGQGDFFGTAQAVNQPKYLPGFGKNGKFVESSRYKTIKITNFNTTDGLTARGTHTGSFTTGTSFQISLNFGTPVAGNSIQLNGNIIAGLEVQSWDPATNTLTTNQTTSMNSGIEVRFIDIEGVEVISAPGQGSFIFVEECLWFYDNNGGEILFNGTLKNAFELEYSAYSGNQPMRVIAEFPRRAIVNHFGDDFYFNSEVTNTIPGQANPQVFNFKNKGVSIKSFTKHYNGSPEVYCRIKYQILNDDFSWIFNTDQTIS